MKTLNKNKAFNENMNYREENLSSISREIQNKIGLIGPNVIDKTFFENNKRKLEELIRNVHHFSQQDWPECFSIFDNIVQQSSKKLKNLQDAFEAKILKTDATYDHLRQHPENHPMHEEADSSDDYPPSKRYRRNSLEYKIDNFGCHRTDGPVNLISVCSILAALEPELGLLAQSIVELLSNSVALEKSKPSSSNDLLEDFKITNLLDTVREKLKGILSANIIELNRIRVVRQAIQNIAILIVAAKSSQQRRFYFF